MAKKNVLNGLYKGEITDLTPELADEYFNTAKSHYQKKLEEFNKYYDLYNAPDSAGEYDDNIIFELIESEIDNNIYMPQVKSKNGLIDQAQFLEDILKNQLKDSDYREFNDIQERNTYIFGGAVTLMYWDRLSRDSSPGGKQKFKAIDPRHFIPQNGINNIDDMDYCFIIETMTKLKLQTLYELNKDDIALLKTDSTYTIDTDLATVKTMYYKDKYEHICRFTWCGNVVLDNDDNIYSDKLFYCTKCGTLKPANIDICPKCQNTEFKLKAVDRKKVIVRERKAIDSKKVKGKKLEYTQEIEIDVIPYVPNKFPITIRKNISSNELFGISDAKMIHSKQKLNNSMINKLADRVLYSGSIVGVPKSMKKDFKMDNTELKIVYFDTPEQAKQIFAKTIQPQLGNETTLMDLSYNKARQTLGITNTFQGREDNSALSSKSKQLQVNQTAGRLESKREMKKASLINMYKLMFQFILAYGYEYQGYYTTYNGEDKYKVFDNKLFLKSLNGTFVYDDQYMFDIDLSATLENNREAMWQENRLNFTSGAYGNSTELQTIRTFWDNMKRVNYPGAKENLDYIDKVIEMKQKEKELENLYKSRELQLQNAQMKSNDMVNSRNAQNASKETDAKLLNSLNKK